MYRAKLIPAQSGYSQRMRFGITARFDLVSLTTHVKYDVALCFVLTKVVGHYWHVVVLMHACSISDSHFQHC